MTSCKNLVSLASPKVSGWKRACAVLLLCTATSIAAPAQTFTTLASFDGTNGASPGWGTLVQGLDGDFYGTTVEGGTDNTCTGGCGTVFKITSGSTLTSLHSFSYSVDGADPYAGLVQGSDGYLYGAIYGGGAHGDGAVFQLTYAGVLTTLYSFGYPNGAGPFAGLVQGSDGNLYGTTYAFGAHNNGTVFKITFGGALTTIYSFCAQTNCTDGALPIGGLVQGSDGNFYGTTTSGGANNDGTVFKLTPEGTLTTLHSFDYADGAQPRAQLLQAANGNFYGSTYQGGAAGAGTLFKITPQGGLTTLYTFCSQPNCTDGADPLGSLVQGTDGNLYGTASVAGVNGAGTLFRITPQGGLTTLYNLCIQVSCADGEDPFGGLVQATDGSFYGATGLGGTSANCSGGCGTVFRLSTGLRPFVKTQPTVGKVGTPVVILGTNLTGATGVTFNGTAATFMVVSGTEITTTVPTGATSGAVKVTRPGGGLRSNVAFRVRP